MTSRELVRAAGRGERVNRTPVTPYMGNYAAALTETAIDEYGTDAALMAGVQQRAQSLLGHDMMVAQSDGYYMAEALGLRTRRRPGTTPIPERPLIEELSDIDRLTVPAPKTGGRMPVYLEAVRLLRRDEELAVRACGTGAFSLAGHLLGPDNLVTRLAVLSVEPSPEAERNLRRLMDICTETSIRFALAALEEGADVVMSGDSLASLDMISPAIYEKWVWPYERRFFEEVRPEADSRGALTLLHICGNTKPILPRMAETGAHILELDWKVSLSEARAAVTSALMGNLDPSAVLLQGTPETVAEAAHHAIEQIAQATGGTCPGGAHHGRAQAAPSGFLLGSGCEVAPATPLQNMRAMVSAVSDNQGVDYNDRT